MKTPYLRKADLLNEIIAAKAKRTANPELTDGECISANFATMLLLITTRYARKPNWCGYTWIEDMKAEATMALIRGALKFDETRFDNPFAYYTQIIKTTFLSAIDKEHRQRDIKDEMATALQMMPSFARQLNSDKSKD